MTQKGWPRESARHSLAARGMRTKQRTPKHKPAVAIEQTDRLKEKPKTENSEPLEVICTQLEDAATTEAGNDEGATKLLADDDWVEMHINELAASFELDDGIKTKLVAKIRKRYGADGEADD